jgi:hypothetical protein
MTFYTFYFSHFKEKTFFSKISVQDLTEVNQISILFFLKKLSNLLLHKFPSHDNRY